MTKVKTKKPPIVCQIEFYHDTTPTAGDAATAFRERIEDRLFNDEWGRWNSVITDSITALTLRFNAESKFRINKGEKFDRRHHAGYATDQLEILLMSGLPAYSGNVGLVCHITEDRVVDGRKQQGGMEIHESLVESMSAPGRLGRARGLASQYEETYRARITEKGVRLQCEGDEDHYACTQIPAPRICLPRYSALWKNSELGPDKHPPIKCIVYGDVGTKKSTFMATFPTPMLVLMADPRGKAMPYYRQFADCIIEEGETPEGMATVVFRRPRKKA